MKSLALVIAVAACTPDDPYPVAPPSNVSPYSGAFEPDAGLDAGGGTVDDGGVIFLDSAVDGGGFLDAPEVPLDAFF
jgi:hypothetical protein